MNIIITLQQAMEMTNKTRSQILWALTKHKIPFLKGRKSYVLTRNSYTLLLKTTGWEVK